MFTRPGRQLTVALAAAVVTVLAISSLAFAAGSTAPVLKTPGAGNNVKAGKIRLVVKDTSADARTYGVFVAINHHKKFDKYHELSSKCAVDKGCDFVQLKRWAHHPGLWTYTAKFNFPGYWAATSGRYFWQANHVGGSSRSGHVTSTIHSFLVVG
jgi:hypothetical protein